MRGEQHARLWGSYCQEKRKEKKILIGCKYIGWEPFVYRDPTISIHFWQREEIIKIISLCFYLLCHVVGKTNKYIYTNNRRNLWQLRKLKKKRQDIKLQFEGSFSPPTMPVRLKQELSDPTNILPWFIPLMDTRNTLNSFTQFIFQK